MNPNQRELVLPTYTDERQRIEADLREAVAQFNLSTESHQRVEVINRVRDLRTQLKANRGEK